ncbi:tetratricopeptide repeat protein [Penaeicola halotolerans]|uniref:tetratricopeptide repeat protein n=1 Tax=Penaeicola halotolerans TaxID=2793196 RepID=UPI001CF91D23|nr:tetratricopeptide repeat protein [Penaeicola halotolerans]
MTKSTAILLLMLAFLDWGSFNEIAQVNRLKTAAEEAFKGGDFEKAIKYNRQLVDSFKVSDPSVLLNLANAYYKSEQNEAATKAYEALLDNADKQAASIAYTQLGIMQAKDKELEKAAELFKQALKKDPKNDNARYNYELVKKMLQKQQQEQDQQDKIEPSEFAKQQKAIADDLVNKRDYRAALQVMIEAYQKDQTVQAYQDFVQRLTEVVEVDN